MIRIKPIMFSGSFESNGWDGTTTDDLPEGLENLYFNGKTTDDLLEGIINKYFTDENIALIDHNILSNLQGGDSTANEFYHLTEEQVDKLDNLSEDNSLTNIDGGSASSVYLITQIINGGKSDTF